MYNTSFTFNLKILNQFPTFKYLRRQGPDHNLSTLKNTDSNQDIKSSTKKVPNSISKEVGNPIFGKIDPIQLFETLVKNNALKGKMT